MFPLEPPPLATVYVPMPPLTTATGVTQCNLRTVFLLIKAHTVCLMKVEREVEVLYYALVFLIVGLIAGVLGATGVAAIASQIAWILFIVGVILLVIHLATGRRGRVV